MRLTMVSALVGCCGFAASAMAQDSTSRHSGLPGDAPNSYLAAEQCANYRVTLAPITSSWGNEFAIAPVLKATGGDQATFFSNLTSAMGISPITIPGSFGGVSYFSWDNAPGQGANPADNNATGTVIPTGNNVLQLAVAASEFSGPYNGVTGGIVKIDPANPSDLYVQRIVAVGNGASSTANSSQIGFGGVDANGNVTFRADNFGATGPNSITGQNWLRVNLLDRACGQLNVLDNAGFTDAPASDWVLVRSATTHSTPTAVPENLAGRPVIIGANFAAAYVFESAPLALTSTSAHRPGTTDHRGRTNFSPVNFYGGIGTSSVIGYFSGEALGFSVFGVDANGAPLSPESHVMPTASGGTITDNFDGFQIFDTKFGASGRWEFDHYHSQTAFRGGNGNFAINTDAADRLLVAGTAYDTGTGGTTNNPINAIIVARIAAPGATPEWTLVAYNNFPSGKAITDGAGNVIGRLVELNQILGAPLGPSMSGPAMDSEGNVFFISAIEIFDGMGGSDFGSGLVRAVYDAATFSYELELVFQTGDVVVGPNSGVDYQIRFLNLADSDSVDSGTLWSNNIVHTPWLNQAPADSSDPSAMGGLVVNAQIVYDTNNDDNFDTLAGSGDENYRVALFVAPGSAPCPPDLTGEGDVNTNDFFLFLALYQAMDPRADFAPGGGINTNDFFAFLAAYQQFFQTGCP